MESKKKLEKKDLFGHFSDRIREWNRGRPKERDMKKLLNSIMLGVFCLSVAFWLTPLSVAEAAMQESSYGTLAGKRCEKCKRGPDGKMVCEQVPCPK